MEKDPEKEKLLQAILDLESANDQMTAELCSLDRLLRKVGFEEGLRTLKFAAQELIHEEQQDFYE